MRRPLVLALDGAISALSLWLALLLRFEGKIPPEWLATVPTVMLLLVVSRMLSNRLLRLDRWSFLLSGLTDGARVGASGLLGTGLLLLWIYLFRLKGPPRSVVVMELLLSTALMAVLRFFPRLAWMYHADRARARRSEGVKTLIVGAGAAGEMLLRDLRRSQEHNYRVLGFVDDDRGKHGHIVGGKPVLGDVGELPALVERHSVGTVLIAIPRVSARRIREILSLCAELKVRFKIMPVSYIDLQERGAATLLQDLSPEDLLPREPVTFGGEMVELAGRIAMVTGGAGSIGSEICRQLLGAGLRRLVMVDFNENNLYLLQRQLTRLHRDATVAAEVASIREASRLRELFERYRPQDVFHAAAHKHVPLMEAAPCESVKNNVLGTRNVAQLAEAFGAERFVFISTDKAVKPSSVMGATKRLGEMLVRSMAETSATQFSTVRFGNVLDSAGSVVPLFREQIAAGGPVTVTDPEVRRYFMTISEAVGLVLKAAYGNFGHLSILEMGEQIRILDLARHMITMSGLAPDVDMPIVFTGLRPGEKLSEELLTEAEEEEHRVDEKISVAVSPLPPADLGERLEELIQAALRGDAQRSLRLLHDLVPGFHRLPTKAPEDDEQRTDPVAVR